MDETETTNQPIKQLVRRVHQNDLSRSRFIALLTGLGASTAGIATLLASPEEARAATLPPRRIHTYQAVQTRISTSMRHMCSGRRTRRNSQVVSARRAVRRWRGRPLRGERMPGH